MSILGTSFYPSSTCSCAYFSIEITCLCDPPWVPSQGSCPPSSPSRPSCPLCSRPDYLSPPVSRTAVALLRPRDPFARGVLVRSPRVPRVPRAPSVCTYPFDCQWMSSWLRTRADSPRRETLSEFSTYHACFPASQVHLNSFDTQSRSSRSRQWRLQSGAGERPGGQPSVGFGVTSNAGRHAAVSCLCWNTTPTAANVSLRTLPMVRLALGLKGASDSFRLVEEHGNPAGSFEWHSGTRPG